MFLDTSNFSKTQLRNSLKVLKHTFSSVKVKHFLSLKNDDFEFNTVLARASVRAARSNYFLEKFNISAFTGKKIICIALLVVSISSFESQTFSNSIFGALGAGSRAPKNHVP